MIVMQGRDKATNDGRAGDAGRGHSCVQHLGRGHTRGGAGCPHAEARGRGEEEGAEEARSRRQLPGLAAEVRPAGLIHERASGPPRREERDGR